MADDRILFFHRNGIEVIRISLFFFTLQYFPYAGRPYFFVYVMAPDNRIGCSLHDNIGKTEGKTYTGVMKFSMRAYILLGALSKINFRNPVFNPVSENYYFRKFPAIRYITYTHCASKRISYVCSFHSLDSMCDAFFLVCCMIQPHSSDNLTVT